MAYKRPLKPLKRPRVKELLYAVDFDGTLADPAPAGRLGDPINSTLERVRQLGHRTGSKVAIYTARPGTDFNLILEFVLSHKLPVSQIVCDKLLADYYIDDRNLKVDEPWL